MATYAIGDIQGCYEPLTRLLEQIGFDPARDRLWLVGDLVNRGPHSLQVLRWARGLGDRAVCVLGNHDLHLLCLDEGLRRPKKGDTLDEVLAAPDRRELLGWLRRRPLLHREGERVLVHAGLLPGWTIEEAESRARELEEVLSGARRAALLERWRGPRSGKRQADLEALDALTRMRLCDEQGRLELEFSGPPEAAPPELAPPRWWPWYAVPGRRTAGRVTIAFGHWAALGLRLEPDVLALDSGCVWGGALSAVRLEDLAVFQVPAAPPGGRRAR